MTGLPGSERRLQGKGVRVTPAQMQFTDFIKLMAGATGLMVLGAACAAAEEKNKPAGEEQSAGKGGENWVSLFNGKDLEGWTPKFVGHKAVENYRDTFRVEDGLLTVSYDKWDEFKQVFGHLFYKTEYSYYRIRAVYRFVGKQVKGGPGWALRNNGLMLHGQTVESMKLGQDFPASIEVQLLGGAEQGRRTTANLCTPGTHVVFGDRVEKRHCIGSRSKTFRGDQWVTCEVEVRGSEGLRHFINGELVMEYKLPQLDDGTLIEKGTISIQAESHPTQFKSIEILEIEK